jgi:4'-phosphopantetheinyl transferase
MEYLKLNWTHPPSEWQLDVHEVHVWAASLRVDAERADEFAHTLSPDETARAKRFVFDRDRKRFTAGRGLLREMLAHYLHREPEQIRFQYSMRGKPSLAGHAENENFHFNLAHSEDVAVFAFSRACPVGVDVERMRRMHDAESIAERFFSARETTLLKSLPEAEKQTGFFNLWTRKEAWLKATGEGIAKLLAQVEVTLRPGEHAQLISILGDTRAAKRWTLHDFEPADGFKAALAVPSLDLKVLCWSWPVEKLAVHLP